MHKLFSYGKQYRQGWLFSIAYPFLFQINKTIIMAVTILEALMNAQFNLVEQKIPGISDKIGAEQLNNAIVLLDKGYGPHDEVETLLNGYDSVDDVPEKTNP